ncbi:hypothetical protein HDU93_002764 [Gonapodya sp. JEL0774]|nr:hypothetical protein HDU93_002764 [Gonapodya sp. JEL0774]
MQTGPKKDPKLGESGMNEGANARLIEAVEWGSASAARRACELGADVGARKKVTLRVKLDSATKETDSVWAESALALAIRNGRPDVVRVLLEAGCDANSRIRWKLSWYHSKWDKKKWDSQRWLEDEAYKYRSALEFALNCGRWDFNKMGAEVVLENPSDWDGVCDRFTLIPSIDIVQLLLKHGARVSEGELQAAKELAKGSNRWGDTFPPEQSYYEVLQAHLRDRQLDTPPASGSSTPIGMDTFAADGLNVHMNGSKAQRTIHHEHEHGTFPQPIRSRTVNRIQNHPRTASTRRSSPSPVSPILPVLDTSDMTQALAEQASTIESQRQLIEDLQKRAVSLEHALEDRGSRIGELERDKLVLEMDNFTMRTDTLVERVHRADRSVSTVNTSVSAAAFATMLELEQVVNGEAPVSVRKLLYAQHPYERRESDEVSLSVGDAIWCIYELADGWGAGTNRNTIQSGFFPMGYLSTSPVSASPMSTVVSQHLEDQSSSHLSAPPLPYRTMSAGLSGISAPNSVSLSNRGLYSPVSNFSTDSIMAPNLRRANIGVTGNPSNAKIGLVGASDDDDSSVCSSSSDSDAGLALPEMRLNGEVVVV